MEAIREPRTVSKTRTLVYAGLIAAVYAVLTIALAPISFGPLQLRLAGLLKPLSLLSPIYGLGLAIGVGLANLASPFGPYDFLVMPFVSFGASLIAYQMQPWPWAACIVQAAIIAIGVALFPLYLGGGIPIWPTVLFVFVSECALYLIGLAILRKTPLWEG